MWEAIASVSVSLIGFFSVYLKFKLDKRKLELELGNSVNEIDDLKVGVSVTFDQISVIQKTVLDIFKKTSADRFLILMSTNGKREHRFTSVVFEQHKDGYTSLSFGATNKYIHFEFDSVYRDMLKEVEKVGVLEYEVSKMKDGDLKLIYENEKVMFSNIYFMNRMNIDQENDKMLYVSIAKHQDEAFSRQENFDMRLAVNKLREISKDFE